MNPLKFITKLATKTVVKEVPPHKNSNGTEIPKHLSKSTQLDINTFDHLLGYQKALNSGLNTFRNQVKVPKPSEKNHVHYTYHGHTTDYYYTDLSTLTNAINAGLKGSSKKGYKDTGLSFTQDSKHLNDLEIMAYTIIRCSNGWQNSVAPVYVKTSSLSPQDVGGALTYAKRYSLSTAFGVPSQTDDDYRPDRHPTGNDNQHVQRPASQGRKHWVSKADWRAKQARQPASKAQINAIDKTVRKWTKVNHSVTVAGADNYLSKAFNFGQNMTKPQASKAITTINNFVKDDTNRAKRAKNNK